MREVMQQLFAFAYLACGDRDDAFEHVLAVVSAADGTAERTDRLGTLARRLAQGRPAHTFAILDSILRSEPTHEIEEVRDADVQALAWELKRACLTATLGCLPASVRVAFILTDALGHAPASGAELLGIGEGAYRVRLTRARKRLSDYLGARCQHLDRANACSCVGALAVARDAGLFGMPPEHDRPAGEHDTNQVGEEIAIVFSRLPVVRLSDPQSCALVPTRVKK